MNKTALVCSSVLSLALVSHAFGQTPAAPAATPPQDYGKGFEKLFALGLPDVATGQYVTASVYSQWSGSDQSMQMQYELKLKGNGWLLREEKQGPSLLVLGQARMLRVWDAKSLAAIRKAEAKGKPAAKLNPRIAYRYGYVEEDGRIGGVWKAADFTNDLAKVLALLEKTPQPPSPEEDASPLNHFTGIPRNDSLQRYQGPLFLLAAQAWKRGCTNEANRMVARLFAASKDPRHVILAAFNELSDQQYNQVYAQFLADRDWAAFSSALGPLLQRSQQGWKNRPGILLLASNVAARATAAVPEIAGEGLTDEDREIARDLASERSVRPQLMGRHMYSGSLWVLNPVSTNKATNAMERILQRGMRSLPLLAALADDNCLLPVDKNTIGGGSYYSSSEESSPEEKAFQIYNQIPRPASRGDLARSLLLPVLMTGDERSYELQRKPSEEIRGLALETAKKCGGKTAIELARLYFDEGNREQRQAAAIRLMRSSDTNDLGRVEAELADSAKLSENMSLLNTYATIRGAAAGPLIRSLAAELGVEAVKPDAAKPARTNAVEEGGADVEEEFSRSSQDYARQQMQSLLALVADEPLEKILSAVVDGTADEEQGQSLLMRRLSQGDRVQTLTALLDTALKATNAQTRVTLVGYARYIQTQGQMYYGGDMDPDASAPAPKPDLAKHKRQWTVLLSDTQRVVQGSASASVAEAAAATLEALYDDRTEAEVSEPEIDDEEPEAIDGSESDAFAMAGVYAGQYARYYPGSQGPDMLVYQAGRRGLAFVLARARARLEGAAIPPYPSGKVDTVRKREVLAQLSDPAQAPKTLAGLSLDECLWLPAGLARNTNLCARLAPLSLRITEFIVPPGDEAAGKLAALWSGKTLERTTVEALLAYVRSRLAAGDSKLVTIIRQAAFDGTAVRIESAAAARKGAMGGYIGYFAGATASDGAAVVGTVGSVRAMWPLEQAAATDTANPAAASEVDALLAEALSDVKAASAKSGDKQRERFWKAVDHLGRTHPANAENAFLMGIAPGDFSKKDRQRYRGSWGDM